MLADSVHWNPPPLFLVTHTISREHNPGSPRFSIWHKSILVDPVIHGLLVALIVNIENRPFRRKSKLFSRYLEMTGIRLAVVFVWMIIMNYDIQVHDIKPKSCWGFRLFCWSCYKPVLIAKGFMFVFVIVIGVDDHINDQRSYHCSIHANDHPNEGDW